MCDERRPPNKYCGSLDMTKRLVGHFICIGGSDELVSDVDETLYIVRCNNVVQCFGNIFTYFLSFRLKIYLN